MPPAPYQLKCLAIGRRLITSASGGGFTLIELLAVIVIVGVVASIAGVSVLSANTSAQFASALASCKQMDARARLLARSCGEAVVLEFDQNAQLLALRAGDSNPYIRQHQFPAELRIEMREAASGAFASHIYFDRLGRSSDYTITIRSASRSAQLTFNGLTGSVQEVRK